MSAITEIARLKSWKFLVTRDIEKAFDSLDHNFLISALKKYRFGKNCILWVKILLRDQEPCVINKVTTTKYFSLGRGLRQSDPISAFLFVLALEFLFILIKSKPEIEEMTIFDCSSLYSAYTDDTTFCLKYIISTENMVDTFDFFALFRIKTKFKKSGIAGIGVLKGVEVVVCGMR